jgi:glycosyltransferase involved in cell wall biosynthesis
MKRSRNYSLVLIGPIENNLNLIPNDIFHEIESSKKIFHFDFNSSPEIFYTIGDIFCLPSHREGFGTSVIEAAAMGLPTIGTNIVGLVDSIVDNQTGILVSKKDSLSLANAIEEILEDDKKRKIMSELALKRAKFLFNSSIVNNYVMDEYLRLVDNTFKFIGSRS